MVVLGVGTLLGFAVCCRANAEHEFEMDNATTMMVGMGRIFHCDAGMLYLVGVCWKDESEVGLLRVFLTELFVKISCFQLIGVLSVYAFCRQLSETTLFVSIEYTFIDLWPNYSFWERLAVVDGLFCPCF